MEIFSISLTFVSSSISLSRANTHRVRLSKSGFKIGAGIEYFPVKSNGKH